MCRVVGQKDPQSLENLIDLSGNPGATWHRLVIVAQSVGSAATWHRLVIVAQAGVPGATWHRPVIVAAEFRAPAP